MSDTNEDAAAMKAVEDFYSGQDDVGSEDAETVGDAPVYTEAQQQADELAEEGLEGEESTEKSEPNEESKPVDVEAQPETAKAPVIDEDLRAIAKESGWSDADVDSLAKLNPELAQRTLMSLAAAYAEQSRQFIPPVPGSSQPAPVVDDKAATTAAQPQLISDDMLKKFAEENGDDAANMVRAIRDHFSAEVAKLNDEIGGMRTANTAREYEAVAREANEAISGIVSKHPALYGDGDATKMTVAQQKRRDELLVTADQIRAGAAAQGRTMTVTKALQHAHYIMSRDSVAAEARKGIADAVRRRAATAVAKPTQRGTAVKPGVRSDAAAMEAVSRWQAENGVE